MGYNRSRLRAGLLLPALPVLFAVGLTYEILLRPIGLGCRKFWHEARAATKRERRELRGNLRFLGEGVVWIFTGRDLTTPRLQAEEKARAEAFYKAKLGNRYKGPR